MSAPAISFRTHPGLEWVTVRAPRLLSWPWHFHARHAVAGLVRSGQGRLILRDAVRELGAGGVFAVPPGVCHALELRAGASLIVVCLGEAWQEGAVLSSCPAAEFPGAEAAARLALLAVRAWRTPRSGNPRLDSVAERFLSRPEEPLSLENAARSAGWSRFHFLRLFSRAFGLTPHAFQLLCRLRRARSLVRAGAPLAEAALAAGFCDQSHMHRAFARHVLLTPLAFKRASITRLYPESAVCSMSNQK